MFNPEQMKNEALKAVREVEIPEFDFDRIFAATIHPIEVDEKYERNMKIFRRIQAASFILDGVLVAYIMRNKEYNIPVKIAGVVGVGVIAATGFYINRSMVEYYSNE